MSPQQRTWRPVSLPGIVRRAGGSIAAMALAIMAGAGAYLVLYVTQWGIGLGSDSAVYVAAARNLLSGYGLSWVNAGLEVRPVTLHGPLLSMLFAGLEVVGVDSLVTAKAVNVVSFALEVLLVGVLARRATGSWALSLLGAYLVLTSGELIEVHSQAMSDALYLALSYIGLVLICSFLSDRKPRHLVWASAAISLACLVRYPGLSLVTAFALLLVVVDIRQPRPLVRNVGILLGIGLTPTILWFIRNLVLTGQATGRNVTFDPPTMLGGIRSMARTVMDWFVPLRIVEWLFEVDSRWVGAVVAASAAGVVLGWFAYRKSAKHPLQFGAEIRTMLAALFSSVAFLGLIPGTSLLSQMAVDIDERILLPAYGLLLIVLVFILRWMWHLRGWLVKGLVVALCVLLLRNKTVSAYWAVRNLEGDGQGYSSAAWRGSATIQALKELSPDAIYTDDIAAVYLLAGRRPYLAPLRLDTVTRELRQSYENDLATMRKRIREEGAVLVLFSPGSLPPELGPFDELTRGLVPVRSHADGIIYGPGP